MKNVHYMTIDELAEEVLGNRQIIKNLLKKIDILEKDNRLLKEGKINRMKNVKKMIKAKDILFFRNGLSKEFEESDRWILNTYYDDELYSTKSDAFDIVSVKRPYYEEIRLNDDDVHTMSRVMLEMELIEKRKEVISLKKELERKKDIINVYGNYIDDMNVKSLVKKKEVNNESIHKNK